MILYGSIHEFKFVTCILYVNTGISRDEYLPEKGLSVVTSTLSVGKTAKADQLQLQLIHINGS